MDMTHHDQFNTLGLKTFDPANFAVDNLTSIDQSPEPFSSAIIEESWFIPSKAEDDFGTKTVSLQFTNTITSIDLKSLGDIDNKFQTAMMELKAAQSDMHMASMMGHFDNKLMGHFDNTVARTMQHRVHKPKTIPEVRPLDSHELSSLERSKQAIFDRVVAASRAQGCLGITVSRSPNYRMINGHTCEPLSARPAYRTESGARCPLGYLIADEDYSPNLEQIKAGDLRVMTAMGLSAYYYTPLSQFLNDIQRGLHDSIPVDLPFLSTFEARARDFATHAGLTYAPAH